MANLTFAAAPAATISGQPVTDNPATVIKIPQDDGGLGQVEIQVSHADNTYVPLSVDRGGPSPDFSISKPGVYAINIPVGWYIRIKRNGGANTINIIVG